MPPRDPKSRIDDILDSIDAILDYTEGMSFEQFAEDRRTNRAVSFEFVVMGEAAAHFPEDYPERYPDLPWREMSGVRNYAVHEYFRLSLEILWEIITRELPSLRNTLEQVKNDL